MPPSTSRPASSSKAPLGQPPSSLPSGPESSKAATAPAALPVEPNTHYTVFVRIPFPRGDFVDPPPVEWNASKDRVLWETLSGASKGTDLDWKELASSFGVLLPFLLQQAAWLYERQLSQVRAQMRKVVVPQSTTTSPVPEWPVGSITLEAQVMKRVGSGGAGPRVPSSLSVRSRDSPNLQSDRGTSSTPVKVQAPNMSRTSSTNTAIASRQIMPPSPRQQTKRNSRGSVVTPLRPEAVAEPIAEVDGPTSNEAPPHPSETAVSSSSSSSESSSPANLRSQIFKRPLGFASRKSPIGHFADDEDEDEDPAFLPFSNPPAAPATQDQSTTLRRDLQLPDAERSSRKAGSAQPRQQRHPTQTAHSSASSASSAPATTNVGADGAQSNRPPPGPLSPRRAAELAGLSPRRRAGGKDGSDGTPSMGSSFSDLDGALL
ncbi:MAG: hypothetical protein M1836_007907 [Candelina mexicana]|nr:MAG: hypothetical protein M1836_007907 [Candelina mexicana]